MAMLPNGARIATRGLVLACVAFCAVEALGEGAQELPMAELRQLYAGSPADWPRPQLKQGASFQEFAPLPPHDAQDQALAAIGQRLFNDPALSGSGQIACASCHNAELGMGDGLRTSYGDKRQRGRRNAMPLYAAAWMTPLFWDGRSATLEEQALHPIMDRKEMAGDARKVQSRIRANADYRAAFAAIDGRQRVTIADVGRALAAYERTLEPPRSRWAQLLAKGGRVLSDEELTGLHLFRTKARCAACHSGPLLSDGLFHNLGISFYGRNREDLGRYEVTHAPEDVGRFRTASLLGIGRTAPYMHNGLFPRLESVVALYNAGGGKDRARRDGNVPPPTSDPLLAPLALTVRERAALVAFLKVL